MTKDKKLPTWIGPDGLPYDEFGVVPTHDYLDPEMARRARALREGAKLSPNKKGGDGKRVIKKRTPEQAKQRKIFFMAQAKKAKKAGVPLADYLSGNKPTPANGGNSGRYGTHQISSSSESDPEEGPAPTKRPRTDFSQPSASDDEMAALVDQANSQVAEAAMDGGMDDRAGEAPGGGGSVGSGGGGGVGQSTGNWSCETAFGSSSIKTIASRHCLCVVRNGHAYKAITNATSTNNPAQGDTSRWLGMSTPWNYIDFNQLDIFFSPQQFQYLVNNSRRFRPRGFTVELFNLQIIQRTYNAGTGDWQFTNDLTSTIQVFYDAGKRYPILSYPNQSTVMSPFPYDIYRCPQYAYLTDQTWTNSNTNNLSALITNYSKFYVLDEHESAMLRTGNNWSCQFEFGPSMGWFDNRRLVTPIHRMMNPLYDTYQTNFQGGDAKIGSFDTWNQPFKPGPYYNLGKQLEGAATTGAANLTAQTRVDMQYGSVITLAPGPPIGNQNPTAHSLTINYQGQTRGYVTDQVDKELAADNVNKATISNISLKNSNPAGPYKAPAADLGTANTADVPWAGVMPGMVWDRRPFHHRSCIWQRVPNTDSGFEPGSELGGIPTSDAPGHIFIKMTPKPVDQGGGNTTPAFVDEFATFTIKITMHWDVEWDKNYAWNPQNLFSWSAADASTSNYWVDGQSNYVCGHVITGKQLSKH
ncbi:structural protein [pigeon parvovirus 1]|uniref:Structural protein n=1 Tax=pigeon parvovirus 1 TaxID=2848031 RepID=U3QY02_9VIRU|nr:structural protein [Pigeon parvovirus A]AGW95845.1 structural protein [pigeon parvovirus 1]